MGPIFTSSSDGSVSEVAQQVRVLWEENHPLFAQWVEMYPFKVLFLTVSTLFRADISVENPNSSQLLGTLRNPWWNLIEKPPYSDFTA